MPTEPFQLLSSTDKPFYPADGLCPVCGSQFRRGLAYLAAGALLLSKGAQNILRPDRLQGFLHVGFHGSDPEMRDSSDVVVVNGLHGGQFDLQWCSVDCMRKWFLKLLAEVERKVQNGHPPEQG